ncbi:MAG: stage II sporulation protein P [Bacilli bacterium]
MKKRFKSRKKKNNKLFLFILITIVSFYLCINFLFNTIFKKQTNNIKLVDLLLNNNLKINQDNMEDVFTVNLKQPLNLLNYNFNNMIKSDEEIDNERTEVVLNTEPVTEEEQKEKFDVSKPLVYIYSTHQTEEYKMSYKESYSITPTVMIASYILQEKLNNLEIPTIVETENMAKIREENNWNYAKSYRASRLLMEKAKEENPSLIYFIDLHRDSAPKSATTAIINEKSYAKILFVVGKDADKYDENLKFVTKINDKIKSENPTLSRGIFLRTGSGSNGIYNQNFNSRTILIELGAQENDIEEVSNTIEVLSKILSEVIEEDVL